MFHTLLLQQIFIPLFLLFLGFKKCLVFKQRLFIDFVNNFINQFRVKIPNKRLPLRIRKYKMA
ncbi:hypothetical protein HCW_08350 [Helicobacter cetorum MIT 00-7128]|uniref:Uncharacterized protein n=1 Tax=Helicobacter cetorum (strain ATCC BAA-429 / MIT 00-7128) TaxID=182217 RepID=I0EPQ8_HELC0|nr:hypothetical protein HCW_08350 [Helicobacter cetorum MIT 00-7128]